ncbi:membrane protein insertase YidC [Roseimicrobium sp. ORNL1]|uniref:membrane protein insertase YidC n=1 Tax=Roseimicrobium sp. ORNL1 TaxID=2711231 RepID=UPI0013E1C576|nr:membrane protein insertase YidC [Roseimicrobium sp. ORNL1]QIF04200.1 membrane protein insertase YidC [Roseimicrobium sp. ORNL1]
MDKKTWIVVTLCVVGMIINAVYLTPKPEPQAVPPVPAAAESNPAAGTGTDATAATPGSAAATASTPSVPAEAVETVELTSTNVRYELTSKGGGVSKTYLLDTKDKVVLNKWGKAPIGALSTAARSYDDLNYKVVEKSDKHVIFEAVSPEKVLIRKEYRFSTGPKVSDNLLDFKITLTNQSGAKISRDNWFIYTGSASELRPDEIERPAFIWNDSGDPHAIHTSRFRDGPNWLGWGKAIVYEENTLPRTRWVGVMSRFYATVINNKEDLPSRTWTERFLIDHSKDEFADNSKAATDHAIHGGMSLPPVELEAGAAKTVEFRIYSGPKIYRDLAAIDTADGNFSRQLNQVMFYGNWFGWVSRFLVQALRTFHDWTGNWGVAIIMLTVAVRSLLWPLQARSNAQMKKMGKLSPLMKEMQEKYKDDPQRMNQEMMKMYREYGVNPVGGCLPLLVQFPIFIGFYTALKSAAELRGQPFIWWVQDLSLPDTVARLNLFFLHLDVNPLPLLMGLTMFLQMKLTPQPATVDKMQQRIFMFMPFMFLFFCYNFASALALYWTFTNIFMIVQAQLTRIWQKEPVLEKKTVIDTKAASVSSMSSYSAGNKQKKDKPKTLRPGGGGAKSTRKPNT